MLVTFQRVKREIRGREIVVFRDWCLSDWGSMYCRFNRILYII